MKENKMTYIITPATLALLPARSIHYGTIAIEGQQCRFLSQTPLDIIKASCDADWSAYDIRRQQVIRHTGFKQKTPIPTNIQQHIIAFPTHSPHHLDCSWIISTPHLHILQHPDKTLLQINNIQTLALNVSKHSLQQQINRAFDLYVYLQQDGKAQG